MKQVIAFFVILALLLTLGCGSKPAGQEVRPADRVQMDTPPAEAAASTGTTAAAVSDVETDLSDIEDLDEDFLSTELEDLDNELDFEI